MHFCYKADLCFWKLHEEGKRWQPIVVKRCELYEKQCLNIVVLVLLRDLKTAHSGY